MLIILPIQAFADDLNAANTSWVLTSTALVLFMTIPGLSLFYGGLVRSKNVLSVLMQCFAITCLASIIWFAFGYSLAFGDGGSMNAYIGNLDNIFLGKLPKTVWLVTYLNVFAMFQLTFAIITPALIVGAYAERMDFGFCDAFSALWLLFVLCSCVSLGLGRRLAGQMGCSILRWHRGHINAGVAALWHAMVMGPRRGFPTTPMTPHNMTMTVPVQACFGLAGLALTLVVALAASGACCNGDGSYAFISAAAGSH